MKNFLVCLFTIAAIVQLISCDKIDALPQTQDPANLVLDIQVSETGSGVVTASAQADHAIEYRFDLGEPNVNPKVLPEGNLTHTYSTTGWYDIEVRAYGTSGRYIKKSSRVFVQVGATVNPDDLGKGYSTPLQYAGMKLVWQDEFNGNSLNTANWTYDIGNGCPNICGWGNNELEYYRTENGWVSDGVLTLEARKISRASVTRRQKFTPKTNSRLNTAVWTSVRCSLKGKAFGLRCGCWVKISIPSAGLPVAK
jgi:hypothetical protein